MDNEGKGRVTVKIFVGFLLKVDLGRQLDQSHAWKQDAIDPHRAEKALTKVHYKKKEYIGQYHDYPMLTVKDLRQEAQRICQSLQGYCPEYRAEPLSINVFPQLFIF
ncbi:MAG: hypothetical protein WB791_01420 [Waddliaceae bacterium]